MRALDGYWGVLGGLDIQADRDLPSIALRPGIGTCAETVGRTLRGWRARHIVSGRQRTIIIHDLEALARIAGIRLARQALNWPPAVPADLGPASPGDPATYPALARRRLGQGLAQLIPDLR